MIFNPDNVENLILWFSFAVFICTFGYSILIINVQALGGLWKVDRISCNSNNGYKRGYWSNRTFICIHNPHDFIYF